MISVLSRASLRHAIRHPWQVLLAALGIALGVSVVTAIDLTESSARQSLADATASIVGRTTHQIVAGPRGVHEAVYVNLRRAGLRLTLAPLIEATVRLPEHDKGRVRLMGVDPIAEAPLRGYWDENEQESGNLTRLIARADTALVSSAAATRLRLSANDRLPIEYAGRGTVLEVIGLLDPAGSDPALAGTELVVVDIATAQEVLGMIGRLSRVDLVLDDERQVEQVRALIGPGVELITAQTRTESLTEMTDAFHTNLTALSLLALLVGMFLIYNSLTFLVVQRRVQIGVLRALGVRRRQLAVMVLSEALVLGGIGTAVGLILGVVLAQGLLGLVTQTINDLYYSLSISGLALDFASLAKGALLGIGGSAIAAAIPAYEAARAAPRSAMSRAELERRAGRAASMALRAGIVLQLVGLAIVLVPSNAVALGLAGLFLFVVGFALISPALTVALSRALQASPLAQRHIAARFALRGVTAALSRTGVAVAALMLAVAHTLGVGIMVTSFRSSVSDWLSTALRADYYVSIPASSGSGADTGLSTDMIDAIAEIPGIETLSHVRYVEVTSAQGGNALAIYQLNERARAGFRFRSNPEPASFWERFEREDAVMVSEPYSFRRGITAGDDVTLRTDSGGREFQVAAIYQDYASDRGTIAMSRATYERHWDDSGINGIGVYAGPAFDISTLEQHLSAITGGERTIDIISNDAILEQSLRVFDRTFTITEVLRLLAGLIAFIGVFSALMAIQLERTRELGIMKAIGVTPRQLRRIVLGETAFIGAAAGLIAIPVGVVMGLVLIYVVNRRSFGWTMDFELEPGMIVSGFVTAVVAALLAGVYPAARMARAEPAEVLRQE
jgi:putative ABC transport system permease protein